MHSSRMRTVRSSGRLCRGGCLLRGGVCSGGCLLQGGCLLLGGLCSKGCVSAPKGWGVCSQGVCLLLRGCLLPGMSAPRGVSAPRGAIPACTEADPPPCGQTHTCKNITFATSLRTVKIELLVNHVKNISATFCR